MDRFHFFSKRSFRYENDEEKTKRSFFHGNRFKKWSFSKTIDLKKLVVSLYTSYLYLSILGVKLA